MISFPYVVPLEPKRYIPLYIRCNSLTLICGLMGRFEVTYGIQKLSGVPFRESDLDIQWEQLDGPEPLEFSDWRGLNPTIMVSPVVIQDMKFRVWLDKGKKDAKYVDVGVYRTPFGAINTDLVNKISGVLTSPLKGSVNTSLRSSTEMPVITGILPIISDGVATGTPSNYEVYFKYPDSFERLGHEVVKATIKTSRGVVIKEVTEFNSRTFKLDYYVPQFYIEWEIRPFAHMKGILRPSSYIVDPKLHSIPYDFANNSIKNLVFTERITDMGDLVHRGEVVKEKNVSFPSIMTYLDLPTSIVFSKNSAMISRSKSIYLGRVFETPLDFLSTYSSVGLVQKLTYVNLKRFNDINIGG